MVHSGSHTDPTTPLSQCGTKRFPKGPFTVSREKQRDSVRVYPREVGSLLQLGRTNTRIADGSGRNENNNDEHSILVEGGRLR